MTISAFNHLACPLDGGPLLRQDANWTCAAGHSFDIARQGYVHLLPVQKKRSLDPGDSKVMVAARQRFLNAGFYQPIADAVTAATLEALPASASCLDAGCGEGYYLRRLAAAVPDEQTLALLGVDISKWAVLAAAKQDKRPGWTVGSNANLPVQSATLDRVLSMFGFPVYAEFARAIKPGGMLIEVDAGPDHLRQLREIVYPSLKPERAEERAAPAGFTGLPPQTVNFPLEINGAEQVADLLAMTPHGYRASAEGREKVAALSALSVTVDVRIRRWVRDDQVTSE
ncbi:MAG: rRNA (guanine-N1)-methyltransferase [Alteromonadaceae bacterium]|uniref:putative RNA methyltransferase n=1 Tax=Marinobacter sp. V034 TaxID=3459610 RepID=UPI000C68502B|nr:rRNA (guanine-N1)-methyltransferase [Alteromonadaceae bacterium]MBH85005.1 rRNA (guanine-N1)-methyltransferase [Alteromonadaceae bacterium]|tara:strand:- start:170 stop:1024 length:855 start_codon:yes stop_codon:yes gene_type:complete